MTHEEKKKKVYELKLNWEPFICMNNNEVDVLLTAHSAEKLLEWNQQSAEFFKVPKGTGSRLNPGTIYRVSIDYHLPEPEPVPEMINYNIADCDCDGSDAHDTEEGVCEKCRATVIICLGCYMILSGCSCGHCNEGDTFNEEG